MTLIESELLIKEYELLFEKERQVTSFLYRFVFTAYSVLGVIIYYALTEKEIVFLAVPFLLSVLILFAEYWRQDITCTSVQMQKISERISKIVDKPVLISTQTGVIYHFFISHPKIKRKLLNTMAVVGILFLIISVTMLVISYIDILKQFERSGLSSIWRYSYLIISIGLIIVSISTVLWDEFSRKTYKFWNEITTNAFKQFEKH